MELGGRKGRSRRCQQHPLRLCGPNSVSGCPPSLSSAVTRRTVPMETLILTPSPPRQAPVLAGHRLLLPPLMYLCPPPTQKG